VAVIFGTDLDGIYHLSFIIVKHVFFFIVDTFKAANLQSHVGFHDNFENVFSK
jgi:hypothetical protein